MLKPYRIAKYYPNGWYAGMIKPDVLQIETKTEALAIAQRYCATYPGQDWRAVEVNESGNIVRDKLSEES